EAARGLLPDVLRRHRALRRVGGDEMRPALLRAEPRALRVRLAVRSGEGLDVHAHDDRDRRSARRFARGAARDLRRQRAEAHAPRRLMSELFISTLVVIAILGAAAIGGAVRTMLPQTHLSEDTKDMVKVGIGFLATLAAMVLGLLVASAKSSYDTKVEEVQQVAAKLILLDSNLRELGPQAEPVRKRLRHVLADRILPLWERG